MNDENGKPGTNLAEEQTALEIFAVDNDELIELESRLGGFNIFDALGIAQAEIRHSNFLAFILDPSESHGHGQIFLKAALMDLLKKASAELRPFSPIELDGIDLRGVEVRREWKNIDIFITCKEPSFAVAVENKVGTHDHSNQLNRYSKTVRESCKDLKPFFVYLTIDGDDPSEETDEKWLSYTYGDIHRVLRRVQKTYRNAIGNDVLTFLDHYLRLLETQFMNDKELDELCRRIYKNHRQALDVIWERARNSEVFDELADYLEKDSKWHVFYRANRYIEFVPKTWVAWLPQLGAYGKDPQYWISVRLLWDGEKLRYYIRVGPMKDAEKRAGLVTALRDGVVQHGFRASEASKIGVKWARITARETVVESSGDAKQDTVEILKEAKNKVDDLYLKLENLEPVVKSLK